MERRGPTFVAIVAVCASVGLAQADIPASLPTNAQTYAAEVDRQLEQVNRKLSMADQGLKKLDEESDLVRRRMFARSRAYYRLVHAGLLPLGAGFETLAAHTAKVERLRTAVEKDLAVSRTLQDQKLALQAQQKQLLDQQGPLQMKQQAMVKARAALMEASDRQRAFDRAFTSSVGADYRAVYGATASTGPADQEPLASSLQGFVSLRGRLPFPVAGRTEVRLVNRPGAGGPGVEMRASPGTTIRAVYTGRVAFADEYPSYGRVVILDHGDRYFTVSGNLGSIDVRVGDDVATGLRLGTVGGLGKEGLFYFEIRKGADTIDPTPWMGL